MINKYFIGTSLDIRLNFWKKGNAEGSTKVEDIPCNISGYRRSVFYKTSKGVINVDDSVCSGSTLTWQFKGTEQRITGIYTIVVILYNGDGSELIHQEFEGFGLIMPKYCYEPPKDRNIIRDAWVELYEFHPVIPEVSTLTENWVVDGVDTGKSSRGSAMFAGTEISNENLVITSSISSIVSKYGKVFKKDDLYLNTSSSDIFKCVSVSTIGLSCTTNWELIGNSQGVGIASFELKVRSEEDGGANIYLLTLTNGRSFQLVVYNGSKGSPFTFDNFTQEQIESLMRPAKEAAAKADEAADNANTKAGEAAKKIEEAQTVINEVNEARKETISATEQAEIATASANTAASKANTASANADKSTELANLKITETQSAIEAVNAARNEAVEATQLTKDATSEAIMATEEVRAAAGTINNKLDRDTIVFITESEYDALVSSGAVDINKIYFITEDE